ncbi:MAG: hypothetical protein AAF705_11135 [Bacteroidota bacterium]
MKNIKYSISSLVILLLLFPSCSEDFLQLDPPGAISSGSFWSSAADAELGLTGCYDALQQNFLFAQRNQNHAALRERECFTDNAMNGFLYQRYNNIKNGTLDATMSIPLLRPWGALYAGIG